MSKFRDNIKAAKAAGASSQRSDLVYPPDGPHNMTVLGYTVKPTKAGDKQRFSIRAVVDHGVHNGKGGFGSNCLDPNDERSCKIFTDLLGAFDLDVDEIVDEVGEDIEAIYNKVGSLIVGKRFQGKVQTREGRQEIRFINKLPADAPPSQRQAAAQGMAAVAAASKDKPAADAPKRPKF